MSCTPHYTVCIAPVFSPPTAPFQHVCNYKKNLAPLPYPSINLSLFLSSVFSPHHYLSLLSILFQALSSSAIFLIFHLISLPYFSSVTHHTLTWFCPLSIPPPFPLVSSYDICECEYVFLYLYHKQNTNLSEHTNYYFNIYPYIQICFQPSYIQCPGGPYIKLNTDAVY